VSCLVCSEFVIHVLLFLLRSPVFKWCATCLPLHSCKYLPSAIHLNYIIMITFITPYPIHRGTGYCFSSISLFAYVYIHLYLSEILIDEIDRFLYLCFFVSKITRKRLDRFAWNFQGRCGMTMGWPDYILVNSEKPRDAAMYNTGTGFVVLSHHSLYSVWDDTDALSRI